MESVLWIVMSGDDDNTVIGVFSTNEKAKMASIEYDKIYNTCSYVIVRTLDVAEL